MNSLWSKCIFSILVLIGNPITGVILGEIHGEKNDTLLGFIVPFYGFLVAVLMS